MHADVVGVKAIAERSTYKWWKQTISAKCLFMWKRQIRNAGKTPVLKRMGTRGDTAQEVNRLPIMWVKGKRVCMQCSATHMPVLRLRSMSCKIGFCQGQRGLWNRGGSVSHCSAPKSLLFNAVFLAYSFSLHLTLAEIYFDCWEKGSKPKQVHGA